jgi:phosphohistidine phosphatase
VLFFFGHNDAITNFVNKFGDVLVANVPTAGFVSLSFDTDCWSQIKMAKTKKIIIPKDLKYPSVTNKIH